MVQLQSELVIIYSPQIRARREGEEGRTGMKGESQGDGKQSGSAGNLLGGN